MKWTVIINWRFRSQTRLCARVKRDRNGGENDYFRRRTNRRELLASRDFIVTIRVKFIGWPFWNCIRIFESASNAANNAGERVIIEQNRSLFDSGLCVTVCAPTRVHAREVAVSSLSCFFSQSIRVCRFCKLATVSVEQMKTITTQRPANNGMAKRKITAKPNIKKIHNKKIQKRLKAAHRRWCMYTYDARSPQSSGFSRMLWLCRH